jgi:hypothetical protein
LTIATAVFVHFLKRDDNMDVKGARFVKDIGKIKNLAARASLNQCTA